MHLDLFLIFLAASAGAASTGVMFPPSVWYAGLIKPDWTPPRWAFPVVWTVLYVASAYAASRVAVLPGNGMALALWALQITLNTLWTPTFFGLHRMAGGLVIILALWCTLVAMMFSFWQLDLIAGLLILPYLGWVTLATALNVSILRANPGA